MKCEKCGKNIANVHYRANYNGNVIEKHLCDSCAKEMGYEPEGFGEDMFENFFNDVGNMFGRSMFGGWGMMPFMMPTMVMPRLEIKYDNAPAQLDGETQEKDSKADPEISKRRQLNLLRSQMKKAVKEERFEDAAKLRDQIKELEK